MENPQPKIPMPIPTPTATSPKGRMIVVPKPRAPEPPKPQKEPEPPPNIFKAPVAQEPKEPKQITASVVLSSNSSTGKGSTPSGEEPAPVGEAALAEYHRAKKRAVATHAESYFPLPSNRGTSIRSLDDIDHVAEILFRGGLTGRDPLPLVKAKIFAGLELGLPATVAVTSLYVPPDGKIEADTGAILAIAQRQPSWRGFEVTWSGSLQDGTRKCVVRVYRNGCPPVEKWMDLKRAQAWGWKSKAWEMDPEHMMERRALSWALRDQYADKIAGIYSRGEISHEEERI